jgi:hypothetical protein
VIPKLDDVLEEDDDEMESNALLWMIGHGLMGE